MLANWIRRRISLASIRDSHHEHGTHRLSWRKNCLTRRFIRQLDTSLFRDVSCLCRRSSFQMHQDSCVFLTYEFLCMLKGKKGGHISPSVINNGNDSNISCELHTSCQCFFLTSIGSSFYTPVTCVFTLRLRVQRLDYELWIDINWLINSVAVIIAIMTLIIRISYFILLIKMSWFWIRFQSDRSASIAIKSLNSQRIWVHNQLVAHTVVKPAVDSARACAVSNHVRNVNVCPLLTLRIFTNNRVFSSGRTRDCLQNPRK